MILNFHPRITAAKGHRVDLTCQISNGRSAAASGGSFYITKRIAYVVQTF
jgi:hypothetical protein